MIGGGDGDDEAKTALRPSYDARQHARERPHAESWARLNKIKPITRAA
jgi:hypothetical protein